MRSVVLKSGRSVVSLENLLVFTKSQELVHNIVTLYTIKVSYHSGAAFNLAYGDENERDEDFDKLKKAFDKAANK